MCEQRPSVTQRSYWPLIWGSVLLVALGAITLGFWQASRPRSGGERLLEHLGNFGTVPEFALIERSERRVTRDELLGLVWVANFFYTSCPDTCPLQSAKLARLQRDVANDRDVRLVSISVDPEHDTPEVLRDYVQRFHADPNRWLFLTGDKAAIYRLAQKGFRLSVVDPEVASPQAPHAPRGVPLGSQSQLRSQDRHADRLTLWSPQALLQWLPGPHLVWAHTEAEHTPLLHSSRFVLVDRQARIRGYYHSDEEAALQRLRRDVQTVLREK